MKMETAICRFCRKPFERRASVSNPRQCCGSMKCVRAQKVFNNPGKPVGFERVPNTPSEYRADIDYHGKYMP